MNYTRGQKVKYTGKGFIGYDKTIPEMTILKKIDHMSYAVSYRDVTMEVYSHEIKKIES